MLTFQQNNIGEFQEKEFGHFFTYRNTSDDWALSSGLIHEVDVGNGYRFGIVKKSVDYISVDEDAYGKPVLEKWFLKKHVSY